MLDESARPAVRLSETPQDRAPNEITMVRLGTPHRLSSGPGVFVDSRLRVHAVLRWPTVQSAGQRGRLERRVRGAEAIKRGLKEEIVGIRRPSGTIHGFGGSRM